MLPKDWNELYTRLAREAAEMAAKIEAEREGVIDRVVRSRRAITESRETLARADDILARDRIIVGWSKCRTATIHETIAEARKLVSETYQALTKH